MPIEPVRRLIAVPVALLAAPLALLLGLGAAAQAQPAPALLEQCAACHGAGGNASLAQMPSLAAQPSLFIENQLVIMREGLRVVPSMDAVLKGLSDEAIVGLARHFAAQPLQASAAPVRDDDYRLGSELSKKFLCGTCHMPDYRGQQQVPRLAGQNEAYLLQVMKEFRDKPGPGRDTIMASTLRGLRDDELGQLAHYLARYLARFKP